MTVLIHTDDKDSVSLKSIQEGTCDVIRARERGGRGLGGGAEQWCRAMMVQSVWWLSRNTGSAALDLHSRPPKGSTERVKGVYRIACWVLVGGCVCSVDGDGDGDARSDTSSSSGCVSSLPVDLCRRVWYAHAHVPPVECDKCTSVRPPPLISFERTLQCARARACVRVCVCVLSVSRGRSGGARAAPLRCPCR